MTYNEAVELVSDEYRFDVSNLARIYWEEAGSPVDRDEEFWHKAVAHAARNLLEFGHPSGPGGGC